MTLYSSSNSVLIFFDTQDIEKDFQYFRLTNGDETIGGMIVCSSNPQAKKIKRWFDEHSELQAGLVISDEEIPTAANKQTQIAFKETLQPDILIVHQMLTTGYDVNRLKKLYLLRHAREHTLLQTISRVNRPYKSPAGKVYQYGYIERYSQQCPICRKPTSEGVSLKRGIPF